MKRLLIIGSGESARRFSKILIDLNFEVGIFQHRENLTKIAGTFPTYNLKSDCFDAVIVASETSTHLFYVKKILSWGIPILVEKPFSDKLAGISQVLKKANLKHVQLMGGFNLRYLPIVKKIKEYLSQKKLGSILFANLYVGHYLPAWRNTDYRKFYSASYTAGGGVALDLIHEIDLALGWFPTVNLRMFRSEKLSNLKIDCEDFVQMVSDSSPKVEITLDYLNHIKTRRYIIVGDRGSIECDVTGQSFKYKGHDGKLEVLTDKKLFEVEATYRAEMEEFLKSSKKFSNLDERSLGIDALRIAIAARKHV